MLTPQTYRIRRISSIDDLRSCLAVVAGHFSPPMAADDVRFEHLYERFDESRPMMVIAERDGEVVGGVFGAVTGDRSNAKLGPVSVDGSVRGTGLARRLMQSVEVEAMALGVRELHLGSKLDARGFYASLGYQGKRTHKHKALPLPGRVRDLKVAKLQTALGDLDEGQLVTTDAETGKVPALW
jgi:predicted N-acetyltransferase YhbS